MKSTQKKSNGFTLIEVIASLLLLGIISVIAGLGTSKVVEGYLITSENSKTSTAVQVALARLEKEFSVINKVKSGSATEITFTGYRNSTEKETQTLSQTLSWPGTSGDSLELNGKSLLDNVTDFTLYYLDTYDDAYDDNDDPPAKSTWTENSKIIGISMTVSGALGIHTKFSTRITPRNLSSTSN